MGNHRIPQPALAAAFLSAAAAGLLCANVRAHDPVKTKFTFLRDVEPIIRRRCAGCHRPGGPGPMSLLDHASARPWAASIRAEVLSGRMPPWPVEEGLAARGAPRLTGREIDVLVNWSSGGAPEGEVVLPAVAPPTADRRAWEIGAPDLVLRPPEPQILPDGKQAAARAVVLVSGLARDSWIGAWELRPSEPAMLHHALIWLGEQKEELLGAWTPGRGAQVYPAGSGRLLRLGALIRMDLHYSRGYQHRGRELRDQSELGLKLLLERPAREVAAQSMNRAQRGVQEAAATGDLLAVTALAGADRITGPIAIEALFPDGKRELILRGRGFRSAWPVALPLRLPLALPAGSRLHLETSPGGGDAPIVIWAELAR